MSDRQRLSLLAATLIITAASVPASSAQTADVMTPVPPAAMLAAAGLEQVAPDASCLTRCGSVRDRRIAELKGRNYWSAFDGIQCQPLAAGPNCLAQREACRAACDPKNYSACINACNQPFQSCCAAADQIRVTQDYDACVVKCPASKVPAEPIKPPTTGDPGKGATIDKKAEFAKMLNYANTMLQAVGPGLDGFDLERFNNLRRSLAFMQVTAALAETNGKFAVVSGGGERLWIILPSGKQIPLGEELGKIFRQHSRESGIRRLDADRAAMEQVKSLTGFSDSEIGDLFNAVGMADVGQPFAPGEMLIFPKGGGWPPDLSKKFLASSEHSSVRGTINGGGDFI